MNDANQRIAEILPAFAAAIDKILAEESSEPCAFVLMTQNGRIVQYASNVEREIGRNIIESLLARWQSDAPDVPANENPEVSDTAADPKDAEIARLGEALAAARRSSAYWHEELNCANRVIDGLRGNLRDIGDFAHDRSSGPAEPDNLWEVRRMAYEAARGEA